jgi:hypothetical protein
MPDAMKSNAGPYDEILGRLNAVVRAKAGYDLLRGTMRALSAASLLLVLAVVVEQASGAGQTFRFWIFTSLVSLAAVAAGWLLWRPVLFFAGLFPGPAPLETAKFVG